MFSRRICNFIGFLTCLGLIAFAYFYMEKQLYLNPCPLCYAQRFALGALGLWFLFATVFPGKKIGAVINGIILLLLSVGGAAISIRHLWIQNAPKDKIPDCGPDVFALFDSVPFFDAVITSLTGTGDCAEVQWTLAGIGIPGWTLIAFVGLGAWAIVHNIVRRY